MTAKQIATAKEKFEKATTEFELDKAFFASRIDYYENRMKQPDAIASREMMKNLRAGLRKAGTRYNNTFRNYNALYERLKGQGVDL